jgi:hypothetical protein
VSGEQAPELAAAVENVYAAFAHVPAPESIPACACCNTGTDWRPGGFQGGTVTTPPLGDGKALRELSDDDVRGYVWDVLLTLGSLADVTYYLPRLLELMARGEHRWDGNALTRRFHTWGHFDEWPSNQQQAVNTLFAAWWSATLATPATGDHVEDVLCTISGVFTDLTPLLDEWLRADGIAVENLSAFLEWEFERLARGGLVDPFWEPGPLAQVVAWVFDPSTYLRYAERDDASSRRVADLLERLEELNAS